VVTRAVELVTALYAFGGARNVCFPTLKRPKFPRTYITYIVFRIDSRKKFPEKTLKKINHVGSRVIKKKSFALLKILVCNVCK
jgi:hypothetical protein